MNAPVVTIFVRHTPECRFGSDEFHKTCKCRKHLRWSAGGKQHRRTAGTRTWSEAVKVQREIEDQLTGKVPQDAPASKNIREAIEVFIADKKVQGVTPEVIGKYERELGRLASYAEGKGVYSVHGLTKELLTLFAGTWAKTYPSTQTCAAVKTRAGGFLKFCFEAQWLARVPSLPKITVDEVPTMPLNAAEYARLLEACDTFTGPVAPAKVRALIQLMRHSGLAIRDALTLRTDRLIHSGQRYRVATSRQKTGTDVSVVLPPDVALEILAVAGTEYIFWDGRQDIVKSWTKYVVPPLFKAAQIEKGGNMMSHRLRDTFAVSLLEKGIPMQDLSMLLGHKSTKVTERSYAQWVKGRQDRLDNLIVDTWAS